MNSLLGIISEAENEKIDYFMVRFEEIKKALKLIKGYLLDFSFSGDLYGKTLMKTLKSYGPSFQTLQNDPTSLNLKINETVSIHENLAKALIAVFLDYPSFINTRLDEFYEKLNNSKKKLLDGTSGALKKYSIAKAQFFKLKLKFEKACKDCELSIQTYKKTQIDPNTMYNQQMLNKLDQRAKYLIKEAVANEQNLKEAKEEAGRKLERWNQVLLEGHQILIGVYRSSFEKFIEALEKYNANYTFFVGGSLKQMKEKQVIEMQNPLMLINEEDERLFLEELKFKENEIPLNKGLYSEINARILQNKDPLKDQEIQLFSELAQKHLETYLILVDERRKVYKSLKNLITEISQMIDSFSKSLQKNSRNSSIFNLGTTNPYYKRLNLFFETFFTSYESLGKKLNNLSLFMGIKVSTLENILKEHKNYEKNLSNTITRALKDIYSTKQNLAKSIQNYERFMGGMSEAEKMKNEVKYMQNKREAEECHEANKEILALLRKMVYESSGVFANAYKEFRNHEQLNLHSIKMILEGVSNQFLLSLDEVNETVKFCSEFFHKKFEINAEIKCLVALDEKLAGYENSENGKFEEEDFSFEPFVLPNEYKTEILEEKKEKLEIAASESNVEDNDKFSEKSLEKDETVGTPKMKDMSMGEDLLEKKEGLNLDSPNQSSQDNNEAKESQIVKDLSKEFSLIGKKKNVKDTFLNTSGLKEKDSSIKESFFKETPKDFLGKDLIKELSSLVKETELSTVHKESNSKEQNPTQKEFNSSKELNLNNKEINSKETTPFKDFNLIKSAIEPTKESQRSLEKAQSTPLDLQGESNSEEWKTLETRFNLTSNDKLITSFACAFAQKILLQGRLYVFNSRLCFHSYFNAQTLFGHTKLNIPIDDIIRFEKRTNAVFFNNAIAVITKGGELFFASFMSRDPTYDLLWKLLPQSPPPPKPLDFLKLDYLSDSKKNEILSTDQEIPKEKGKSPNEIDQVMLSDDLSGKKNKKNSFGEQLHRLSLSLATDPKPQQILLFQERAQRIEKLLIPIKNYKETLNHTFQDANLKDVFISVFGIGSDFSAIKHKGSNFSHFFELYMNENKEENVVIGKWEPQPPKFYRSMDNFDFEELCNYSDFSSLEISFHHPVKEKIIFAPKFSCCTDTYKVFWISNEEIVIQTETRFAKIPFADYFMARKAYFLKADKEKNVVEMSVKFYVDMIKSTIFQSRIEKGTYDETKEFLKEVYFPLASKIHKEYLHRIKDKFGNEALSSRVLIAKKMRKSTKEVIFLDEINSGEINKESYKENPIIKENYKENSASKENYRENKEDLKEIIEEIRGMNEKMDEIMKKSEKEKKDMILEIKALKNMIMGLIFLGFLMFVKGNL